MKGQNYKFPMKKPMEKEIAFFMNEHMLSAREAETDLKYLLPVLGAVLNFEILWIHQNSPPEL